MKINKLMLLILSIGLLGSCAKESGMRIQTNTFANKEEIPKGFEKKDSFSIAAKQKGDSLFTQEVSQKIAAVLKDKGFRIEEAGDADYSLNFSFGMKRSTHTREVPVYIPDYGRWSYYSYYHRYGGYRVTYVPKIYTLFNKILLLEVYKKNSEVPVWQGTAHSYEEDSNLRDAIDYLLVTVFKYFGKNTRRYVKSKMEDDNKDVKKLRQEYYQETGFFKKK
jgi:hypothetical protein